MNFIRQDMVMKAPEAMLFNLKITYSDNLRRKLKEIIKTLSSFCSSEHMPVKEALEGEQSRQSSSEHMLAKENNQDEWLLRG